MSKISKLPTVTRIVGILVTMLVTVTVYPVADVKRCQRCQTFTGMAGVLITILVTVTILDVARLESANAHKDGGRPDHDPRVVIVFDVADPQNANNHSAGACPPPPRLQGRGKRFE